MFLYEGLTLSFAGSNACVVLSCYSKDHFEQSQFEEIARSSAGGKKLKPNAIPTLFSFGDPAYPAVTTPYILLPMKPEPGNWTWKGISSWIFYITLDVAGEDACISTTGTEVQVVSDAISSWPGTVGVDPVVFDRSNSSHRTSTTHSVRAKYHYLD